MSQPQYILDMSAGDEDDDTPIGGNNEWPVAEPGIYLAQIAQEPEIRQKDGSKHPYFNWRFKLHDEKYTHSVFDITSWAPADMCVQKLRKFLKAAGINKSVNLTNLPPVEGNWVLLTLDKVVDDYRTTADKIVYKNTILNIKADPGPEDEDSDGENSEEYAYARQERLPAI